MSMTWQVLFHEEFDPEFEALPAVVQDELLAQLVLLRRFGPQLGRPRVDTLKGSRHANMKERSETRFYRQLIAKADRRFDQHLQHIRKKKP